MSIKSETFVIILAAGNATRLRPLSNRVPKPLIDISGVPIITRIIGTFKNAGFTNFCVLFGYKGELIKHEVSRIDGINVELVEQKELSGTADAILLCTTFLNRKYKISKFFVSAADILFSFNEIRDMDLLFNNSNADMILSLMKSKDLDIARGHGNVKISDISMELDITSGLKIFDIIEKPEPDEILSDFYSLPLYLFNQKVTNYLKNVQKSKRGEREFQDGIKFAINNGDIILGINIIKELITIKNVGKYHLTYLRDIIEMNKKISPELKKGKNSKIGLSCILVDDIIYENVILGDNCILTRCIVDSGVQLPNGYSASDSFITQGSDGTIKLIEF